MSEILKDGALTSQREDDIYDYTTERKLKDIEIELVVDNTKGRDIIQDVDYSIY